MIRPILNPTLSLALGFTLLSIPCRHGQHQISIQFSFCLRVAQEDNFFLHLTLLNSLHFVLQESEWLRVTLHEWLDDEYCPEPTNVVISKLAARSYYESLTKGQSDLGEILLNMVKDLETISYQESFHGPFSSANAAVHLITQRMDSLVDSDS